MLRPSRASFASPSAAAAWAAVAWALVAMVAVAMEAVAVAAVAMAAVPMRLLMRMWPIGQRTPMQRASPEARAPYL
jgi:hypothetical protein